jgi:hypothetical protein
MSYDSAKLFMFPSGGKQETNFGRLYSQKPLDGTGDFIIQRGSGKFAKKANGQYTLVSGNDFPAFNYKNGCPCLSVEESASNFFLQSANVGVWTKNNVQLANPTQNPETDSPISGSGSFTWLAASSVNSTHSVIREANVVAGVEYTASVFVKASFFTQLAISYQVQGFGQIRRVIFDVSNGSIVQNTFGLKTHVEYVYNGWWRIGVSNVATQTINTNIHFNLCLNQATSFQGDGNTQNHLCITGGMFELGDKMTSYIGTTTQTASRAEDRITLNSLSGVSQVSVTQNGITTTQPVVFPYRIPFGQIEKIEMQ